MDDKQLDVLVDAIADKVKSRLFGNAASINLRPHQHEASSSHEESCLSCGLNPMPLSQAQAPIKNMPSPKEVARYIDHTLLKGDTPREEIEQLCNDAKAHNFFSVCVNSTNVRLAASFLSGASVKVCAVVGFPLGAGTPAAKAFEAREAVRCGADEIDMVMNIGAMRSKDYALVMEDISKVVKAVPGKTVKVILETGMLTHEEKIIACSLSKVANATFVKTSTGFGPGGATIEDIKLMRQVVGPDIGVKASGGVRSYDDAKAMIEAGANRLGCSSSVAIVTGGQGKSGY